jgi:uncharacterized membrane protein YheB (UPF0754 family)
MYEKSQDILSAVDVRSLVKNKIDSLDIMTVERILLDVLAAQFKWITSLGLYWEPSWDDTDPSGPHF